MQALKTELTIMIEQELKKGFEIITRRLEVLETKTQPESEE